MQQDDSILKRAPDVFVFNPFAEGYIALSKAFTPVRHQAQMAEDLANLPQFLCEPDDLVLLRKRPSDRFLDVLKEAGFLSPRFVELNNGRIDPSAPDSQRRLGSLRPWAWGPDSVKLLEPLFAHAAGGATEAADYFHAGIARLYSKAWSADFLRKVLSCCGTSQDRRTTRHPRSGSAMLEAWLCSDKEAGVAVDTLEDALEAVAAIRKRGHHRVVVKKAYGLAGHNALRLWEPELLPTQRQWLIRALNNGQRLVVEPWLERKLDFSVQLEMEDRGLMLRGFTGLITDLKGQFAANWAELDHRQNPPANVAACLNDEMNSPSRVKGLYDEILPFLEAELRTAGFFGPISIDSFLYRTDHGDCRLKPVVEINPRYTMGRLTVELMKHASAGSCGVFRLLSRAQARGEGFADFSAYARSLAERLPLKMERAAGEELKIRQGAVCLNDPDEAQACLATFEVGNAASVCQRPTNPCGN